MSEDKIEFDKNGLPEITDKQFNFVMGVAEGKNYSDAYRNAYNTTTARNATIWTAASDLAADPKVSQWIDAIAEGKFVRRRKTLEERIAQMDMLSKKALDSKNLGAAVNAAEKAGKLEGHYVEKREDVGATKDTVRALKALKNAIDEKQLIELAASVNVEEKDLKDSLH